MAQAMRNEVGENNLTEITAPFGKLLVVTGRGRSQEMRVHAFAENAHTAIGHKIPGQTCRAILPGLERSVSSLAFVPFTAQRLFLLFA